MIWLRIAGLSLLAAVACIVLFCLELNVLPASALRDNIAYAIAFVGSALALVSGIVYFKSLWVGRRERRAGYTTTYDKNDRDLWLLDWRTGEMLYRPGEPPHDPTKRPSLT